ncbi:MAG: lipopolysaccharide biosynthesis protein [Hungatella sp.]|nr:lipopolysaccharide biosynthesis protein [Hungatella sp.]MCI9362501.1 lipopolysaccharide biosynthesis protein [Hungatella sp.]
MRKAVIINFISKYSVVIVQLIINFILARLLSPEEFGIVAIITIFTSFLLIFSDMGIGTAIIQYKDLEQNDINNIFSFTVYLGVILSVVFVGIVQLVSIIYSKSIYFKLGLVLMPSVFLNTLNMVPNALMMKEQRFIEVGIRNYITTFVCGILVIILAVWGFSYYSLVVQSMLQALILFIWNYTRRPLKFNFYFDWAPLKRIFGFSGYQFLFNIINYFARNTDTLMVGQIMGEASAGIYDKAYKLMTYPMTMFSGVITPILHPVLSNFQNDKDTLYNYTIKIFRIMLYFSIFISTVCFFSPREIIHILYGDNWDLAIEPFRILSLSVVTQMCNSIGGAVLQSLGKTKIIFKSGLISAITIIMCICIGIWGGTMESVATMVMIAYMIVFWIAYYYIIKVGFGINYFDFLKITVKPYFIYIIMAFVAGMLPLKIENDFFSLFIKTCIVCLLYLVLLYIFKELENVKQVCRLLYDRKKYAKKER